MKKNNTEEERIRRPMKRYKADVHLGLTQEQVREYRRNGWDNYSVEPPSKSTREIIRSNLLTYFNFLFLFLSILLVIVGSFKDLTFLPVIIANTLIGIIQELNAKKVLDNLSVMNAPKCRVVRDGRVKSVPSDHLVLDDIVLFSAGNQICADAVVAEGEVAVNESLLTGESDEIIKRPGDHLMSGSYIVSGSCYARLEKVGPDSYISKLTIQAKASKEGEQSEMVRSLNRLVVVLGIIIIPIGIILFYQAYYVNQSTLKDAVTSMVAAVIGMIPEGLFLLSSVTLAVSAVKLAMKKVLVHDMKCIETLARVDVLCVDKTGTITENTMKVSGVVRLPGYDEASMAPVDELLSDFAAAQSKDNITMAALKEHFSKSGDRTAAAVTGFSSANKYSSVTFRDGAYVLGAPEFVLRSEYAEYKDEIEEQSAKGYRVLVFGKYRGIPDGGPLKEPVDPLCLVLMSNPIRKDAPETFRFFADQGVDIKVISGDNPVTVSEVAKRACIKNAENYIDASTLKTEKDIYQAVQHYTVFGRVTPNQKRQFVRCLKKAGRTVAMTGDGVNDVLALKDADCSVAMASGSDAAAQASQLVLLESDFARMPDVVMEGRQVVNNMERSGSLFLVKNIFSLLISLLSIWYALSYPLRPSQISLISMFTIGIPAFFLSQVPNQNLIHGHFISNILLKALPAGLTDAFVVGSMVIFGEVFDVSTIDISTASTILLGIVGFMILYQISKPMDKYKWAIWIGCVAALLFSLIFLKDLFGITGMSMRCVMLFVMFSIVCEPVFRYLTRFFNWATIAVRRIRGKLLRRRSKELQKAK
ncbi:MAG: cation-translocating P-type ATPase [Lachnospiraceae bacterium]|jgi:cation-transporting ATPase E|nr:cation-translocating P-type ATPase [Lachnospiraceae bacterium]MCI1327485.1 cation-translocating P-type ATPase [Lachnospiraceae bacterium]